MTATQLAALWLGMAGVLLGALAKLIRILMRVARALEAIPVIRSDVDRQGARLTALERAVTLPRYDGLVLLDPPPAPPLPGA